MKTPTAVVVVAPLAAVLSQVPADHSWLSSSEQTRLNALKVQSRRDQYLAGHWLLRQQLARFRGQTPQHWTLNDRPGLPPQLQAETEAPMHLSLTHSGDWLACAWSDSPIGIDLEQRRPHPALSSFQNILRALDDPAQLDEDTLLQRWVIKESLLKRDHSSAWPQTLAALQIQRASVEESEVELLSTDAFHLAVATDGPKDRNTQIELELPIRAREHWRVRSC